MNYKGRTPHGVRGLKFSRLKGIRYQACRTPHGVRGLKYLLIYSIYYIDLLSHPTRGAWIEISMSYPYISQHSPSRTPHGVRGLKYRLDVAIGVRLDVAPHTGCVD